MKNELIMLVEESVYAQGDDLAALRSNVKDALLCHIDRCCKKAASSFIITLNREE